MKKYIKIVSLLTLLSMYFGTDAQYTVVDADVYMSNDTITGLTEQGKKMTGKSIIIPETLQGQTVKVIGKNVFAHLNLKGVIKLPPTLERVEKKAFYKNKEMYFPNFQDLKNLKYLGSDSFREIGCSSNYSKLDFSNLAKLECLSYGTFFFTPKEITSVDFSNCTRLKSIGVWAISSSTIKEVNLSNCINLSYIDIFNFSSTIFEQDTIFPLAAKVNFSNCNSLIYVSPLSFGVGHKQMESLKLPTPKIKNLTFTSWVKTAITPYGVVTNFDDDRIILDDVGIGWLAQFKEVVISIMQLTNYHGFGPKNISPTYQEILTSINRQKNKKNGVTFHIVNHSIQQVNISAIKTTNGATLSWQKGTIKTGETQKVVVTYPKGTTDYSNTISIEGPDLKGNTTVKISKTGETTTDNNMLSSVAQEQLAREQNKLLSVYPNPALSELHISYSKPQESYRVKIISLQGKTMYQNNRFQGTSVNVEHLPPAIYLIQVNESVKTFIKH